MELLEEWVKEPHKLGHLLGFTKLTEIHGEWVRQFIDNRSISVVQAHRNAYKTTSGLVGLALLFMMYPNLRVLIVRKTIEMSQKLVAAMDKIFAHDLMRMWMYQAYDVTSLKTDHWSRSSLILSIKKSITAEPSLQAAGINNARTGDHYDLIWCDDIITADDRYSKAEREKTKNYIYELENIIEPTGVQRFTGTPWHPDDAFKILPEPKRYPIGSVVIQGVDAEWIAKKQRTLPKSLWAANYELKHVKDVSPEFSDPIEGVPPDGLTRYLYIDPSFGGKDSTAIWEGCTDGELYYLTWAKMYRQSISEKWAEIEAIFWARNISKIIYEKNGAQKLVGDELDRRNLPNEGITNVSNKYARITNVLKPVWDNIRFHPEVLKVPEERVDNIEEQAPVPIVELVEYNIDAEHDDSPDACAGMIAFLHSGNEINHDDLMDIQRQIG